MSVMADAKGIKDAKMQKMQKSPQFIYAVMSVCKSMSVNFISSSLDIIVKECRELFQKKGVCED